MARIVKRGRSAQPWERGSGGKKKCNLKKIGDPLRAKKGGWWIFRGTQTFLGPQLGTQRLFLGSLKLAKGV